jgi:hypothetical protein
MDYSPYGQKSAWKGPNQWPYVNDTAPRKLLKETFTTQPAVIENYIVQPGVPWWAERDYRRRGDFLVDSTGQKMLMPWGRQWKYQTPYGPDVLRGGNFYPEAIGRDVNRWQRKIERSGPGRRPSTPMYYSMLQNFYQNNPGASNLF